MTNRYTRLLELSPESHEPTAQCGLQAQSALKAAWSVAAHYLSSNATAETTSAIALAVFEAFSGHIVCKDCLDQRSKAVVNVVEKWDEIVLLPFNVSNATSNSA
ncbi:hypothetical protein D9758_006144 [Tetrapyrgos nigripes]|uniref:Uncharacterized protein n=1 Tax=Tetrapyrgos nigripes TaxID=182062 RepID=A0A8H5LLE5_9AGAR|nr:hypothetical protein D9758_006144 [Tetrapyrgos nigripes]